MGLTRQTAIGSGVKKLEPRIQRWDWGYKPL